MKYIIYNFYLIKKLIYIKKNKNVYYDFTSNINILTY